MIATHLAAVDARAPRHCFAPAGELGIYPVVPDLSWLERLLAAGATTLQLRCKRPMSHEQRLEQVDAAVALGRRHGARVWVNDHWQAALACGAWGVHLGQEDLEGADLVALRQAGVRLGISTHNWVEVARARAALPSYIAIGHLFPTRSKQMASRPQGVAALKAQLAALGGAVQTVTIGGIGLHHLALLRTTGVDGVAMISALCAAADPERALKAALALWQGEVRS